MAYKVVCTKCGQPVRMKVHAPGVYWHLACKCQSSTVYYLPVADWKIEPSGTISKPDRQQYCAGCEDNFYK